MRMHHTVTVDRIIETAERSMESLDSPGICVDCGADIDGVEPDARKYPCECCGERKVFGAQELAIMVM